MPKPSKYSRANDQKNFWDNIGDWWDENVTRRRQAPQAQPMTPDYVAANRADLADTFRTTQTPEEIAAEREAAAAFARGSR